MGFLSGLAKVIGGAMPGGQWLLPATKAVTSGSLKQGVNEFGDVYKSNLALGAAGLGAGLGAGGGLSSLAGSIGKAFGNTFAPGGNVDLGKIVGTAGSVMDLIGRGQQRKSAQDYTNAEIAQRNALMSRILAPQNYGVNLNQQSSATPGAGSGTTGGSY